MPSIDWEVIGKIALFSLTLWILIRVWHGQFKSVFGMAKRKEAKRRGKNKRIQKPKRGNKYPKLSQAELEATVRQMFPEPPEPTERSRVREAMVTLVRQSARGLFELLPEETCVGQHRRAVASRKALAAQVQHGYMIQSLGLGMRNPGIISLLYPICQNGLFHLYYPCHLSLTQLKVLPQSMVARQEVARPPPAWHGRGSLSDHAEVHYFAAGSDGMSTSYFLGGLLYIPRPGL
jgi:hypothetical protein